MKNSSGGHNSKFVIYFWHLNIIIPLNKPSIISLASVMAQHYYLQKYSQETKLYVIHSVLYT